MGNKRTLQLKLACARMTELNRCVQMFCVLPSFFLPSHNSLLWEREWVDKIQPQRHTHTLLSIALVFSLLSAEYIGMTVYRQTVAYVVIMKSVESGQVYTALGDTVSLRLWPYPFPHPTTPHSICLLSVFFS